MRGDRFAAACKAKTFLGGGFYAYLGNMRASTNPLAYCEGGFLGGKLKLSDKIKPLLKAATASFGITAFNELQMLYNGKSLVEDGSFALEVLEYINKEVNRFKEEDGNLYAIYGTPAENLCGLQVKQFRAKYGIVEGVSDRDYVSNSFHCHVTEDITPIQKQNLEYRFWELSNGGKIQYVKYPIDYNITAIKTLVRRAMDMGFYEGVNLSLAYCDDCGDVDVLLLHPHLRPQPHRGDEQESWRLDALPTAIWHQGRVPR